MKKLSEATLGDLTNHTCDVCGKNLELHEIDHTENIAWLSCPEFLAGDDNHASYNVPLADTGEGEKQGDLLKMKNNQIFERNGEWSGYSITKSNSKSEKGFVATLWSRIQGGIDGAKYLYKFDETFTPETDLNAPWNEGMTYGEYLGQTIREQYRRAGEYGVETNIVCLKRGSRVR